MERPEVTLIQNLGKSLIDYAYYMLTASGAAIAFSLNQVHDKEPSYILIFLLVALVLWSLSFYNGIQLLTMYRKHMSKNIVLILKDKEFHEIVETLDPISQNLESAGRYQYRFFLIGVLSYVIWQGLDIWSRA